MNAESNNSSVQHYNATDRNPYTGQSFYRLKQTDFNGQYVYSDIRAVKIEKRNSPVKIYPSPVIAQLNIKGDAAELKTIKIYNLVGQDVTRLITGNEINSTHIVLDVSRLPKGTYTIKTVKTATNVIKQ